MVNFEAPEVSQIPKKSRNPRREKTLEDVMGSVRNSPNLREQQRRSTLSALRKVAQCLGQSPSQISARPAELQKQLAEVNHLQCGITKRRWTNIRSLTLSSLRTSGAKIMPSRWQHSKFSAEWSALRKSCSSQYHLIGLSRFMNFCSTRGVEPQNVNAQTFENFRLNIEESLVRNPKKVFQYTCRLWNTGHRYSEAWPAFRNDLAAPAKGYSLEWSTFPDSFVADVEAFLSFGGNRDILSDDYAPSVKPATTLGRRKSLRQMATALVASGLPVTEIKSLGTLVEPGNATEILRFFLARAGGKPTEALYAHACLLRTVARSWVKNVPDHPKLEKLCRNIASTLDKNRGMKQRNRARLRQFDDQKNVAALLGLPAELLRLARQQDTGTSASVTFAVYAVAIEILTVAPMRIKNLVSLDLEKNVIIPKDERHGRVIITIDAEEVKNSMALEFEMPKSTTSMIQTYLREFRPRITSTQSNWLFPIPSGRRRNIVGFGSQMSTVIFRHTGLEMNPHLFRHFAVKLIEAQSPGSAELERRLLGHHNIATTIRSYSENKTTAAHKHYEDLIETKRGELGIFAHKHESARP